MNKDFCMECTLAFVSSMKDCFLLNIRAVLIQLLFFEGEVYPYQLN